MEVTFEYMWLTLRAFLEGSLDVLRNQKNSGMLNTCNLPCNACRLPGSVFFFKSLGNPNVFRGGVTGYYLGLWT